MDTKVQGYVWLFGAIALLGLYGFVRLVPRAADERPHGRFTRAQIVERAAQLAYLFSGSGREVFISPERISSENSMRNKVPFWFVDYSDQNGRHLGRAEWDARTGTLMNLDRSAMRPIEKIGSVRERNRELSVGRAIDWSRKLLDGQIDTPWNLRAPPICSGVIWAIQIRYGNHNVTVRIHGPTGGLMGFRAWNRD